MQFPSERLEHTSSVTGGEDISVVAGEIQPPDLPAAAVDERERVKTVVAEGGVARRGGCKGGGRDGGRLCGCEYRAAQDPVERSLIPAVMA